MKYKSSIKLSEWSGWILVPLRLFLGVTFVYAGVQKLTDPQYFDPAARGYIGRQIAAFATGSPLHDFLTSVAVPHAALFGALVAYGELAIGACVLLGLFSRVASLGGLLLNLTFFLSADWHVFPYFYGSDIVFLFCWLTLLIAGPANQVLPALDIRLAQWLVEGTEQEKQPGRAAFCRWFFGVKIGLDAWPTQPQPVSQLWPTQPRPVPQSWTAQPGQPSASAYRAWQLQQAKQQGRRNFLWGALGGGAAVIFLTYVVEALHLLPGSSAGANDPGAQITPTLGSPVANETPTATLPNGVIAKIGDVPLNSSASFTIPSNGDPGILIHLSNGQFVAFDATCTHAGCPVDYDPSLKNLVCPCHGAAFDPARAAAVVNGPAQTPLTSVPIKVDQNTGTISLNQ